MAPLQNFAIDQGGNFSYTVQVDEDGSPKDLTGWDAKLQIRDRRLGNAATNALLWATLTVGDGLTILGPAGQVLIEIAGADTAAFDDWTNAEYDLYLYSPSGEPYRVLQGRVSVSHRITV